MALLQPVTGGHVAVAGQDASAAGGPLATLPCSWPIATGQVADATVGLLATLLLVCCYQPGCRRCWWLASHIFLGLLALLLVACWPQYS